MMHVREAEPDGTGDARLQAVNEGDILADVSLWWRRTPMYEGARTGFLGLYRARSRDAAGNILVAAQERLAAAGCCVAIGPIDDSTWHSYRFVTAGEDDAPPFFLEPKNPKEWPHDFRDAGFEVFARYRSYEDLDLTKRDGRLVRLQSMMDSLGVTMRTIDIERYNDEMRAIHVLCEKSFSRNLLYAPIEPEDFLALYAPVRMLIDQRLTLIAERDGQVVGFAFAIQDRLDPSGRTAVIKTIARDPAKVYAGLGGLLSDRIRLAVSDAGFTRAIHALMHESNTSLAISRRFGRPIRSYALFSKALS